MSRCNSPDRIPVNASTANWVFRVPRAAPSKRSICSSEGPPFEVVSLVIDGKLGTATVVLDDGSEETLREDSLGMDPQTGRFTCLVRDGRAHAVLSRPAHQTLLAHIEQEGGRFFLQAGARRLPVRA